MAWVELLLLGGFWVDDSPAYEWGFEVASGSVQREVCNLCVTNFHMQTVCPVRGIRQLEQISISRLAVFSLTEDGAFGL